MCCTLEDVKYTVEDVQYLKDIIDSFRDTFSTVEDIQFCSACGFPCKVLNILHSLMVSPHNTRYPPQYWTDVPEVKSFQASNCPLRF